jgi:hypothetical protein
MTHSDRLATAPGQISATLGIKKNGVLYQEALVHKAQKAETRLSVLIHIEQDTLPHRGEIEGRHI